MRFLPSLFLLFCIPCFGQLTSVQQKALNAYVDYANTSADEVDAVVKSIIAYAPKVDYHKSHPKNNWGLPRYVCPIQLEDYYYNAITTQSKNLGASAAILNSSGKSLRAAAEAIDKKCKELDTYHKLEDYKQDDFAKAEVIVNELQVLLADYRKKQNALQKDLDDVHKKLTASATQGMYRKADEQMRKEVMRERALLDLLTFNIKEDVHTGWAVDELTKSIQATDNQIKVLKQSNPALKYPASSMWSSFQENLGSMLEVKRSALNGYNFEAKKSDKHSNQVYMDLINYYNGTLVSDYNTFIGFCERDGYYGMKVIKYFPMYEIRSEVKSVEVDVKSFKDIPRVPVVVAGQKAPIQAAAFSSLVLYVDFINETWRQTRNLQSTIGSFNSTASYFKGLDSYEKRAPMNFEYKDYQVPLAEFQKTLADSKALAPAIAKSLNDQAEVLLNILKEMDDQCASLEIEVKEKRYEKDHLTKVYEIMERLKVLFEVWDERKELLYWDVRKVYDAYPVANAASSWQKSGKALRELTDLDHDALFKAKAFYKGDSSITVPTEAINAKLRDVIANEYENMKGIEKYGRYNGLCPYTPYEDLPKTSKSLAEAAANLKSAANKSRYEHPYYRLVYHYNDIVDDYNKFCELSKTVPHLPTVHQPELFIVKYPEPKKANEAISRREEPPAQQKETPSAQSKKETQQESQREKPQDVVNTAVTQTKVQHDTVFIERRDTVYLTDNDTNLRSMEGYATNNMILLLDVSGSMNSPEKLPLLKESVLNMLSMMREEDKVSIIAFSGKPKVLLESVSFKNEAKIKKAINDLKSSGKTDGNAGLKLAYGIADENYIRGGNNRIILATDGQFATSEETLALIQKFSKEDIFLTIFNFGKGAGASKELENLAGMGKGNYSYISKENVEVKLIREAKAKKKK
jgi:Ca-activated chloride channel family protein